MVAPSEKALFNRLPQLRIAVNAQCKRACFYCRPSGEGIGTDARLQLTTKEVYAVASAFCALGGSLIKITGGDPALWEPLVITVALLKTLPGLKQVEVISRHPSIGLQAPWLRDAGVDVINMSIDTLRPERHKQITGVDDLEAVLAAARICVQSGVHCKINTVVMRSVNEDELEEIVEFCEAIGISSLKFLDVIRDLDSDPRSFAPRLQQVHAASVADLYIPMESVAARFRSSAVRTLRIEQGGLGHPMTVFVRKSGLQLVLKDHFAGAWYGEICERCEHFPCHDALMALRMTADRQLQFCLLGGQFSINLKPHLDVGQNALTQVMSSALAVYDKAVFHSSPPPMRQRELVQIAVRDRT